MANVQVMRNKMNLNINAVNLEQCIKISWKHEMDYVFIEHSAKSSNCRIFLHIMDSKK